MPSTIIAKALVIVTMSFANPAVNEEVTVTATKEVPVSQCKQAVTELTSKFESVYGAQNMTEYQSHCKPLPVPTIIPPQYSLQSSM